MGFLLIGWWCLLEQVLPDQLDYRKPSGWRLNPSVCWLTSRRRAMCLSKLRLLKLREGGCTDLIGKGRGALWSSFFKVNEQKFDKWEMNSRRKPWEKKRVPPLLDTCRNVFIVAKKRKVLRSEVGTIKFTIKYGNDTSLLYWIIYCYGRSRYKNWVKGYGLAESI